MRKFKVLLPLLLAIGLLGASQFKPHSEPKILVTLQLSDTKNELKWIQSRDWDIAGVNLEEKQVDLIITQRDLDLLDVRGWKILRQGLLASEFAPDAQYKDPAEVESILRALADAHPTLSKLVSIGKSLQGRDIWALKISDMPELREEQEPAILFNGMHHAREVMTPEVPLDAAEYLLTRYETDPQVKSWVNSNEIWIVPMVNPDGNSIVWSKDSMWRKNAREGYGVDLNRNYPYAWNTCNGSSGQKYSQTYRGASAASEPETVAFMEFIKTIKPVFNISFHSYSELVIYPEGCDGKRTRHPEVVEKIGKEIAALLPSDTDPKKTYKAGTAWELLYSVDGGDIDWMYNALGVIPYVIELNASLQGFQPDYGKWRDKTVEKTRLAWSFLLNRLDQSGIRGVIRNTQGQTLSGADVQVSQKAKDGKWSENPMLAKSHADGSFHVVLNPGTYAVKISAPGFEAQNFEVLLDDEREDFSIVLDASL